MSEEMAFESPNRTPQYSFDSPQELIVASKIFWALEVEDYGEKVVGLWSGYSFSSFSTEMGKEKIPNTPHVILRKITEEGHVGHDWNIATLLSLLTP